MLLLLGSDAMPLPFSLTLSPRLFISHMRVCVDSGCGSEVKEVIINGRLNLSECVIAGFKLYHHFASSL